MSPLNQNSQAGSPFYREKYDFILYFRSGPIPLIPTSKSHTYML